MPIGGVRGIERHVGGARLEDAQHCRVHVHGARDQQGDARPRSHAARLPALLATALLAATCQAVRADEVEDWWEGGETRWFLGGRVDLGTFEHLGLAAGWGKPHWMWAGVEAHGVASLDFGSASANVRLALPAIDLSAGWRVTRAWWHLPLPDLPSQPTLPEAGGFAYQALDLIGFGVLPTPGGLALWEVNAVRILDPPPGAQIYEEWLRMVCAPPWCGMARLAWMASLRGARSIWGRERNGHSWTGAAVPSWCGSGPSSPGGSRRT